MYISVIEVMCLFIYLLLCLLKDKIGFYFDNEIVKLNDKNISPTSIIAYKIIKKKEEDFGHLIITRSSHWGARS
jgi:hypothetical protein